MRGAEVSRGACRGEDREALKKYFGGFSVHVA